METWLKIKYYTPVFKGKVAETEIQENNPCEMAQKRRGTDTVSVSAGKRNRGQAEKKPTLLIPVERCQEGELQPCTSKRELGCSEKRGPSPEGTARRGDEALCQDGTRTDPTAPFPVPPSSAGSSTLLFCFFFLVIYSLFLILFWESVNTECGAGASALGPSRSGPDPAAGLGMSPGCIWSHLAGAEGKNPFPTLPPTPARQ